MSMSKEAVNDMQVAHFLRANMEHSISYWKDQPTDRVGSLNSFDGEWSFTDHRYIPDPIMAFLEEYYFGSVRIERVPIEDINKLMNEIWQGPGSMPMIIERTYEIAKARHESSTLDSATVLKDIAVRSIDDYDN